MAEVRVNELPKKTREMFDRATAALERGNLDYGIDMLITLLETEPRLLQARKLVRAAALRRYRERNPNLIKRLWLQLLLLPKILALQAAMVKNPMKALHGAERVLTVDPLNEQAALLAARAAEAAGLYEVAIQTLETIRERKPNDVELLYQLAELQDRIGDTHAARLTYEKIVELQPNDPRALKALKDAQAKDTLRQGWDQAGRKKGDFVKVLKDAEEAHKLEIQAKAVKTAEDADILIADLKSKIEQEPENVNYRRALADLYERCGRYDDALEALREADRIAGGGDPQLDRAMSEVRLHKFDAEIESLRKSGRTAEAEAKAREREAFRLEDAARRVNRYPNDLQFKYEYGVLLYEHGQYTEAIAQLQQAQRHPQRRISALFYLALCFEKKGQLDIAVEQLEKALSEVPPMDAMRKDVLYELGLLYEKMGQAGKAFDCFKQIYAVDIGYRDVAARVERRSPSPHGQ